MQEQPGQVTGAIDHYEAVILQNHGLPGPRVDVLVLEQCVRDRAHQVCHVLPNRVEYDPRPAIIILAN